METQYHVPQIDAKSKNKYKNEDKWNLIKFWLDTSAHKKH